MSAPVTPGTTEPPPGKDTGTQTLSSPHNAPQGTLVHAAAVCQCWWCRHGGAWVVPVKGEW